MKTTAIQKFNQLIKNYFFINFKTGHQKACACENCQQNEFVEYQQYYQQTTRWQTV